MQLNIELITLEEEIKNLRQKGSEEELNAAERKLAVVKENIRFMEDEQKLLLYQMELEKDLIEERLAFVEEGSLYEYRLKEQLMNKTADIEKEKAKNSAETVKKITAENNAAIKKMYDELFNEIKDFGERLSKFQTEPFMTELQLRIQAITKEAQELRDELAKRFRLGTAYQEQSISGGAFGDFALTARYLSDLDAINKAEKKRKEDAGEEEKSFLGLDPDELKKLKKIVDEALNIFSDYYAARNEIAKNAIEKEQALLEKKFEAGLIRENEYNEETKKNKEEMAKLDRDAARFGVLINTAQAIVKLYTDFDAITATILAAGVVAVGATQLSAINSAPLPEFHEGGLDIKKNDNKRQNRGLKSGEFYAKLLEGESVMTREETAKYKDVLKAIREDSLPSHIMKGYTAPAYHRSMDEPYRMAKEQTSLELAFQNAELVDAIRRNGAVAIKNPDEIADAIVSKSSYTKITNRRRIR